MQRTMSNNFPTQNQEQIVGGEYRLGAVLHRSVASTVYETEFGDHAHRAVLKIRLLETPDAGRDQSRWREAMELTHPNLLRIYAVGQSVVDDVPVSYVVMERADESLAGVLAERTLSDAETREMLTPTLAVLGYLHKNGYAHSNLKASNILAVGDLLKLSSDDIRKIGDGAAPADDMWALGTVLVQALTQQTPMIEENAGPYILREGSQLFTDIVRHCLDPDPETRWTADQVEARLNAPAVVPIAEPVQVSRPRAEEADAVPPSRTPKWVFAALAALVLIVILVAVARREAAGPKTVARPAPVEQVTSEPSAPVPSTPAREGAAPRSVSIPAPAAPAKPAASVNTGRRGEGWAVIAAAYTTREPAEKRSREMARRWSNFKWGVFSQQAGKTYYLVVIGQNLSEDEAEKLRERAVRSGLPRDTYIKKLQ